MCVSRFWKQVGSAFGFTVKGNVFAAKFIFALCACEYYMLDAGVHSMAYTLAGGKGVKPKQRRKERKKKKTMTNL